MLRLKGILEKHGEGQNKDARKIGICESLLSGIVNQTTPISARSHKLISAYLESIGVDGEAADWHLSEDKGVRMLQQDVLLKFRLGSDPFVNEIRDPDGDCYVTSETRWVEQRLHQIIDGKGFAALVGPTGAGKSTLMDRITATKNNLAVAKPRMCDTEALHAGAIYDALIYDFTKETPKRSREARARQMIRALEAKQEAGEHALLMVEEAHRLHGSTPRALKSFYDEKLQGRRLLSIVLVGQEPLAHKIGAMLEVKRRCQVLTLHGLNRIVEGKMLPPTATTIKAYLRKKFEHAGAGGAAVDVAEVFDEGAFEAIAKRVNVPLHLNCLASAAMTVAWEQTAKGKPAIVTAEIVNVC